MNLQTTKIGTHLARFDSMTELAAYANPEKYKDRGAGFMGVQATDWTSILSKSVECWAEGLEVLQMFIERLEKMEFTDIKSVKRTTKYTFDEGDEVDVERMQQGEAYMRKTEREGEATVPTITVMIDTTTPAFMDSDDILWRGAAAIALTKILELKGYAVDLWVVNGSFLFADDHRPVMTACNLKRAADPLDVSTLVNTVSGWFYRTGVFTVLETICERNGHKVNFGYGHCYTPSQDDLDSLSDDPVRIYSSGVFSFNGACQVIQAELDRIREGKTANE